MGVLVKGFRSGVLILTEAGPFRNGSNPAPGQADALKALGFTLEKTKQTQVAVAPIFSTMRSEQIDSDLESRKQADIRADEVASYAAATQNNGNGSGDGQRGPGGDKPDRDGDPQSGDQE